jgi:hypothetical protein
VRICTKKIKRIHRDSWPTHLSCINGFGVCWRGLRSSLFVYTLLSCFRHVSVADDLGRRHRDAETLVATSEYNGCCAYVRLWLLLQRLGSMMMVTLRWDICKIKNLIKLFCCSFIMLLLLLQETEVYDNWIGRVGTAPSAIRSYLLLLLL